MIVTVSVCLRVSNIHIMITCVLTFNLCYYSPHTPTHSQVMSDGNVSLGDNEIDKLVVLRMN